MGPQATSRFCRFSRLTILTVGLVFGSSCGFAELQAISAGITAAASALDDRDDDISFGDWLADELRDL
jgi:hypothetical protein